MCVCGGVCRLIHAFTCAGILPSQYSHFSQFADVGVIRKWYIHSSKCKIINSGVLYFYKLFYQDSDYVGVVSRCTAQSMARAVTEVKALIALHHRERGIRCMRESCKYCVDHTFVIMHELIELLSCHIR